MKYTCGQGKKQIILTDYDYKDDQSDNPHDDHHLQHKDSMLVAQSPRTQTCQCILTQTHLEVLPPVLPLQLAGLLFKLGSPLLQRICNIITRKIVVPHIMMVDAFKFCTKLYNATASADFFLIWRMKISLKGSHFSSIEAAVTTASHQGMEITISNTYIQEMKKKRKTPTEK